MKAFLIKKDLPVEVTRIIHQRNIFKMRNDLCMCGAYILILRSDKTKIYIGSTKNFCARMTSHKSDRIRGHIPDSAYLYETKNIEDAILLEKYLIKKIWGIGYNILNIQNK